MQMIKNILKLLFGLTKPTSGERLLEEHKAQNTTIFWR